MKTTGVTSEPKFLVSHWVGRLIGWAESADKGVTEFAVDSHQMPMIGNNPYLFDAPSAFGFVLVNI